MRFALFKVRIALFAVLRGAKVIFYVDLLFCFGHTKGKSTVKITNLKRITLKKSGSLVHKERIAPVTLYLKTTFSPVALFVNSDGSESLLSLFYVNRKGRERAKVR